MDYHHLCQSQREQDVFFGFFQKHQKFPIFYSQNLSDEIDFIHTQFHEIIDKRKEEISKLDKSIIFKSETSIGNRRPVTELHQ